MRPQPSLAAHLILLILLTTDLAHAGSSISREGDIIHLNAGIISKVLRLSEGNVLPERMTVAGREVLSGQSNEISLKISLANPNRNPLETAVSKGGALTVETGESGGTDVLDVKKSGKQKADGAVSWPAMGTFAGRSWGDRFDLTKADIFTPRPQTHRLVIRTRSRKDPALAGVSIYLNYEVYDGYPVIRKWVEVHNNSANWIKLSELVIDDIQILPAFQNRVLLTPSERGAAASLIAFSHKDRRGGIIVASEVPSALRSINAQGASGYSNEHFEWVLGPAESFTSEPVFVYGYSGDILTTPSSESLPLDRAVETNFRKFLKERLNLSPDGVEIAAPLWATWTNFGPLITDSIIREQAEIVARCGFKTMELDDGWQRDRLGTAPHPKTFPEFEKTCDFILSKGLRLGLWVSCFRSDGAPDFKALPNAAIQPNANRLSGKAMSFASSWANYYAHDLISLHDIHGATYFKQDFTNIKYGDFAKGHDSRTSKESLLRGLRGLLEAQATVRRLAPTVANEITHEIYWGTPGVPCDLAALKNVSFYHIPPNDYSGAGPTKRRVGDQWKDDPEKLHKNLLTGCFNARQRFFAHRGLPLECIEYYGAATVNWKGSLTPEVQDRQICSWLMGAPTVYSGDLASLTDENIARYRKRFDTLKRLEQEYDIYRHFQYSGVPAPTDTDWHWWGKLNSRGCGAVVVIRGSMGADQREINIPWVQPDRQYKVRALFQEKDLGTFSGKQLAGGELKLELPTMGQEILELSEQP